jgi:hypothetical protein
MHTLKNSDAQNRSSILFAAVLSAVVACSTPSLAAGPALTSLYSFGGYLGDGIMPQSPLAIGSNGVLYGTANFGGAYGYGAVFSLTPPSSAGGVWTETLLWSFGSAGDGQFPYGGGVLIGPLPKGVCKRSVAADAQLLKDGHHWTPVRKG